MVQQDLKIWIILIYITDARRGGYIIFGRSRRVGAEKERSFGGLRRR
jgi:hypothetical protein